MALDLRRANRSCASVMFFTGPADRLARRELPVEFNNPSAGLPRPEKCLVGPRDVIFRPRRVTPRLWLLPPPLGSVDLATLDGLPAWTDVYPKGWDDKAYETYERFWTDLAAVLGKAFGKYHQVGGTAFPGTESVEADCVKYGDDDYANNPPEEEKAFRESSEKEERAPAAQATSSAPATGNSCCNSPATARSGRGASGVPRIAA
jgi:hypothetical protein